jgi:hypothetical protein
MDEPDYDQLLVDEGLRRAFLAYADERGLDTSVYGPRGAWNNMLTALHFSAFAWAWAKGLPEVPDPKRHALWCAVGRWYDDEVAPSAEGMGQPLAPWGDLPPERQDAVIEQWKALQQEMGALGRSLSSPPPGRR